MTILACFCTDKQLVRSTWRPKSIMTIDVFSLSLLRLYTHSSPPKYHNSTTSFRQSEFHSFSLPNSLTDIFICLLPCRHESARSTGNSEDSVSMAEDSLQCLRALSGSPAGVLYLLKYHSMQALARAYITQNSGLFNN